MHPSTAAFADNMAQQAEAKVQASSDRQQQAQPAHRQAHQEATRREQESAAGPGGQQLHYQETAGSSRKGSDRRNAGVLLASLSVYLAHSCQCWAFRI